MEPDDIKAKLAEVDAKMRSKMAELGFTPAEIDRQMDRSIPEDVKKVEREEILARKFANDLADPNSGLMDAIIGKVAGDLEAKLAPPPRKSKVPLIIGAVVAVAAIGIAVWYVALRDTTSSCQKLVGPIAELEQLVGTQLEMRSGYESKYSCYQYVDRRGKAGGSVVNIETSNGTTIQSALVGVAGRGFIETQTFQTALGEATLFVAGESKAPSPEEMLADAQSRVGKTSDPMGAVLASLPPSQHVALMQGKDKVIKIQLDRELFSVDKAKTFVTAVAQRAK